MTLLLTGGVLLLQQEFDRQSRALALDTGREAAAGADRVGQFFADRIEQLDTVARVPLVSQGTPAEIKAFFESLVDPQSSFSGGLSLVGTDGYMVLLSGFPLDESRIDLRDRDYVRAVLDTGRPAVGNAIVGRLSGDPLVTVAVPVRDAGGRTTAIVAGTIRIDLPDGGLARIGATRDDLVIIDGLGQVVLDRGVVVLPTPADDALLATTTGRGVRADVPRGQGAGTWLAGFAPVEGTSWRVVVPRDPVASLADARATRDVELLSLGLLGVLGLGGAALAGRRVNRTTEAARDRERLLTAFAQAMPVAAGALDDDLSTRHANDAMRALGPSLPGLLSSEDLQAVKALVAGGRGGTAEVRLRSAGGAAGGERWHRLRLAPAPAGAGPRWLAAIEDIDAEKRAELDLRRDIRQRDEFLGLVSHELRTPLAVVIGNARNLLDHQAAHLSARVVDQLSEIADGSRRLQRMLENMLVLSRVAALAAEPDLEPQQPARLVERTLGEFAAAYPSVQTCLTVEPDLPIVLANEVYVDQVVWNLLTNAMKYGGRDPQVDVTVRRRDPWVEVSVADRGPGLERDDLSRIFEPHFRSPQVRSQPTGLGLGLSVCQRLVELQGGEIRADARPGGGLIVAFTLEALPDDGL